LLKLPFDGIINIISFGVDVYKKIRQRRKYEKDMATIAELEHIIDDDKLRNKTNKNNRQQDNGALGSSG